jgi:hypothetical protein
MALRVLFRPIVKGELKHSAALLWTIAHEAKGVPEGRTAKRLRREDDAVSTLIVLDNTRVKNSASHPLVFCVVPFSHQLHSKDVSIPSNTLWEIPDPQHHLLTNRCYYQYIWTLSH